MTDGSSWRCRVSGGAASTQAKLTDMRTAAGRLDTYGGDAGDLCASALGIGASVPAKSALLSPGSAMRIAELVAGLSINLGALGVRMEFVARTLRWSATAYELTDEAQRRLLSGINVLTAPARLGNDVGTAAIHAWSRHPMTLSMLGGGDLRPWTESFSDELNEEVTADPGLADGLVPWLEAGVWVGGSTLAAGQFGAASFASGRHLTPPPLPGNFEDQIGWLLASGRMFGFFNDTQPLSVTQTAARTSPVTTRDLADLVQASADVEHRSDKAKSVLSVRRVVGADGKGAWIVVIPGTTHWSAYTDNGPSDATANLVTMTGQPSSLYPAIGNALATAMKESGVQPGAEPVLLTGHSQGGIVATRLAVDDTFRSTYNVREVVTAGSPIDRMKVPPDVNVLSLENTHDIIPRVDGRPAPDAINRVDVGCAAPSSEHVRQITDAHDASRYVRQARELTADSDETLQQWYDRNGKFLTGRETDYEFQLRRP
ncbi:hypothetical protein [Flexivirga caeni]|uniref:GPI inositol-deacylase PGAP1-like alpha/beta domain-containing protein n=1 Tax=Flexivirga caeni TaxID=2294115 RepID=A0A3M9MKF7_9MICO|nr:hypothetical protein [Flexivirga caeni]RNI25373.1 hypothetical protein EFY87_01720 [Flexivirga caeni]